MKSNDNNAIQGTLPTYSKSFFAGKKREDGLKLAPFYKDGCASVDFYVDRRFQGYPDVVNGGITFGVLDVLLWYSILIDTKKVAMTRKVEMEFFKPILCNTHYMALSKTTDIEGKNIKAVAWVEDSEGEVYAKVDAIFRQGKGLDARTILSRMDFTNVPLQMKDFFLTQIDGD